MIKYYCDKCGTQMTPFKLKKQSPLGRVKRKLGIFQVEIMTCKGDTWNSAILCTPCVLEIVNNGKDNV